MLYICILFVKGVFLVFEKNLTIGFLLDFYGVLLSDRKRSVMDMYYNEDFSLAEVAEEIGISRQGVRDVIKKAEEELLFYEERLGLAKKMQDAEKEVTKLSALAVGTDIPDEIRERIIKLAELIRQ